MLRDEIKALQNTSKRDLRKFALMVGGIFCVVGAWWFVRHKPFYWCVLATGVPLLLLGATAPRALKWVYVAWMSLALVLGAMVSTVLLTLLFFMVVTPLGFLARLAGKDFLNRKWDPAASSYWISRDTSRRKTQQDHEQQF
jgi:hypothetical protein